MYDVLLNGIEMEDCIEPTEVRGLFVAPASLDLAGAEIELVPAFSRESKLKRRSTEVIDDYDFILIDCPPSLGLLTVNGLVAATEVLVPIQCEYYALEGLAQLTRNVDLVRDNLNPALEISGIVLVMYDKRGTSSAAHVVSDVRNHFGAQVCRNVIPAKHQAVRSTVVRPAHHRVRPELAGRGRVSGARPGGQQWRVRVASAED